MVLITIVLGVYKPTYNWGAPHCRCPFPIGWLIFIEGVEGLPSLPLEQVSMMIDGINQLPAQTYFYQKDIIVTLWLFNIAMEHGPFLDDFPIKTSIEKGFFMAMWNNQMVIISINI